MLPFGISNALHTPSNGVGNASTSILSNANDSMNENGSQCAPSFLFGQTQHGLKRRNHTPSSIVSTPGILRAVGPNVSPAGKSVHWSPLLVQESSSMRRDADKESTKNLVTSSLFSGPPLRSLMDDPPPEKQLRAADGSFRPPSGYSFAGGQRTGVNGSNFVFASPHGANDSITEEPTAPADTSQRREQDYWVTIFGFPVERTSAILEFFSKHGNIVSHKSPKAGNWVNVRYSSTIHAHQALVRNAKLIDGIMIGVVPCSDPEVIGECADTTDGQRSNVIHFRANTFTAPANLSTCSSFATPSNGANTTDGGAADKSAGGDFSLNSLNTTGGGRQSRLSISSRSGMRPLNRNDFIKNNSLNNSSLHQKSSDESLFEKFLNYIAPH